MITPDEEISMAIFRLRGDPNFLRIVQWLNDSLVSQSKDNNHTTGPETIKNQGRNLELENLISHIKDAGPNIDRLRAPKAGLV